MTIKDIRSRTRVMPANIRGVTSNAFVTGVTIDTLEFEFGLMFATFARDFTDGTYVFELQESENEDFTGPTTTDIVDNSPKLIGSLLGLGLTSSSVDGSILSTLGVISTLRYIRMNIRPSGVSIGAIIVVYGFQMGEYLPLVNT